MKTVRGETKSETRLLKAIQLAADADPDGAMGPATLVAMADKLGADCWPLTIKLYGHPAIVGREVRACNPRKGCGAFENSCSGSFSWAGQPCSILVTDGEVISGTACHAHLGKPETVLYKDGAGHFGWMKCKNAGELPEVRWAVGGMGLLNKWDPEEEGFAGQYGDVLRRTDHTVLAQKGSLVYCIYFYRKTAGEINGILRDYLEADRAILLDGGHVAAMNGSEGFSRINRNQIQFSLLQVE